MPIVTRPQGIVHIDLSIEPVCEFALNTRWPNAAQCVGDGQAIFLGRWWCGCCVIMCQACRERNEGELQPYLDRIMRLRCPTCNRTYVSRGCDLIRWISM